MDSSDKKVVTILAIVIVAVTVFSMAVMFLSYTVTHQYIERDKFYAAHCQKVQTAHNDLNTTTDYKCEDN